MFVVVLEDEGQVGLGLLFLVLQQIQKMSVPVGVQKQGFHLDGSVYIHQWVNSQSNGNQKKTLFL